MARKLVQYVNKAKDILSWLDSSGKWWALWFETSGHYKSTISGSADKSDSDPFVQQGTGSSPLEVDSDLLNENLNAEKLGNYTGNFYFGLNGSTGVTSFVGITNVGDGVHFNVGAATGYIVDNNTNPDEPIVTRVTYAGGSNLTTPYKNTDYLTYLMLDTDGSLVMQPSFPTCVERRERIYLGNIVHPLGTVIAVQNTPDYIQSSQSQLRDLWRAFRLINEGITYSANDSSLKINRNAGRIYGTGIAFTTTPLSPNRIDLPSQTALTFSYRSQTGAGVDNITDVDPNTWDDGGVLSTVDNNKFTVQRIYITPSGLTRIQYGQKVYPDIETAAKFANDPFNTYVALARDAIVVAALVVKQGTTNLADPTKARFIAASKLGELGGGGGSASASTEAVNVTITDAGGHFVATNVEDALQEAGLSLSKVVNTDGNIVVNDTRSTATSTDLGLRGARFDFKANTTDGLSDGGSYHGVMTLQQWNDSSGGTTHQLGITDNNNLWIRSATIGGSWGSWKRLAAIDEVPTVTVSSSEPGSPKSGDLWLVP